MNSAISIACPGMYSIVETRDEDAESTSDITGAKYVII